MNDVKSYLVFLVMLLLLYACKTGDKNRPPRREQAAAGFAEARNVLGIEGNCQSEGDGGLLVDSKDDKFTDTLKNSLSSVPKKVLSLFVENGGKISLVDDVSGICGFSEKEGSYIVGCLDYGSGQPTVFIDQTEVDSTQGSRGLVRLLGAFFYKYYENSYWEGDGFAKISNPHQVEIDSFYESYVKESAGSVLGVGNDKGIAFATFFEDYYCNEQSRNLLNTVAPESFSFFEKIANGIDSDGYGLVGQRIYGLKTKVLVDSMNYFESSAVRNLDIQDIRLLQRLNDFDKSVQTKWSHEGAVYGQMSQVSVNKLNFGDILDPGFLAKFSGQQKAKAREFVGEVEQLRADFERRIQELTEAGESTLNLRLQYATIFRVPTWRVALKPHVIADLTRDLPAGSQPSQLAIKTALKNQANIVPEMFARQAYISVVRHIRAIGLDARLKKTGSSAIGTTADGLLPEARIPLNEQLKVLEKFQDKMGADADAIRRLLFTKQPLSVDEIARRLEGFKSKEYYSQLIGAFGVKKSEAGVVIITGGTSGSGKSASLKSLGVDADSALSPDPIKSFMVHPANPQRVRLSADGVHVEASVINKRVTKAMNEDYSSSVVVDATLKDISVVQEALASGKRVSVKFTFIAFDQSVLRVLNRRVGGDAPLLKFEELKSIYRETTSSLEEIIRLSKDPKFKGQMSLEIFGPEMSRSGTLRVEDFFEGGVLQKRPKKWSSEDLESALALYKSRFDELSTRGESITVRELLGTEGNPGRFISPSEASDLRTSGELTEFMDTTVARALDTKAARI